MSELSCDQVSERLSEVLEGSAPPAVLDHLAGCDACRDAGHDAERAARLVAAAGNDFEMPAGLLDYLRPGSPETIPEAPLEAAPSPAGKAPSKLPALAKRWAIPVLAAAVAATILAGRSEDAGTSADDPELVGPPWRGKVSKLLTQSGKLEVWAPQ